MFATSCAKFVIFAVATVTVLSGERIYRCLGPSRESDCKDDEIHINEGDALELLVSDNCVKPGERISCRKKIVATYNNDACAYCKVNLKFNKVQSEICNKTVFSLSEGHYAEYYSLSSPEQTYYEITNKRTLATVNLCTPSEITSSDNAVIIDFNFNYSYFQNDFLIKITQHSITTNRLLIYSILFPSLAVFILINSIIILLCRRRRIRRMHEQIQTANCAGEILSYSLSNQSNSQTTTGPPPPYHAIHSSTTSELVDCAAPETGKDKTSLIAQ